MKMSNGWKTGGQLRLAAQTVQALSSHTHEVRPVLPVLQLHAEEINIDHQQLHIREEIMEGRDFLESLVS